MQTASKRKKRMKMNGVIRLILILATLSLVIIKLIQWNVIDENVTYNVPQSEISLEESYRGIIVRNEYPYTVNFSGKLSQVVDDGDRVKKNQWLMDIVRGEETSTSMGESDMITDLPTVITKAELEDRINSIESDIAKAVKNEEYAIIPDLAIDLSLQIEALKTKNDTKEIPEWVQSVGDDSIRVGEKMSVYAKQSGIVTFYIDGFEDFFTYERVINSQLDKYLEMDITAKIAGGNDVEQGDIIYKIIDDSEYYIIVIADKATYKQFELYSDVIIQSGNQEVTGTVEKFIPTGDKVGIAIKVTSYLEDFHKKRYIDVTIKQEAFKGLEIKASSIVRTDKGIGVYVVDRVGKVSFKPIQVIYNAGDTVLVRRDIFYEFDEFGDRQIETISLHDRVINIAEDFKEGDTVK